MALILPSVGIAQIKGKVGGVTFSRNAAGLYLKTSTNPVLSFTRLKNNAVSITNTVNRAWQKLTGAQRNRWDAWADFQGFTTGTFAKTTAPGQTAHMIVNSYLVRAGQSIIVEPTFTPYSFEPFVFYIERNGSNLDCVFDVSPDASLFVPLIQLSAPTPITRGFKQSSVVYVEWSNPSDYVYRLTADYRSSFGIIPDAGATLNYNIIIIELANGTFSPELTGQTIVQ